MLTANGLTKPKYFVKVRLMKDRYFTPKEANDLVPWVEEKLTVCREAKRFMLYKLKKMEKMSTLKAASLDNALVPKDYFEALMAFYNRLREVEQAGIIVRDIETGLSDFPCFAEGRTVFLCWRFGEKRIDYWHEEDEGFAGRQPLESLLLENVENEDPH